MAEVTLPQAAPAPVPTPAPIPPPALPRPQSKRDRFGRFVRVREDKGGEELVDIRVHNPLKRLYAAIDYLKTHGDIPITLRTRIPFAWIAVGLVLLLSVTGIVKLVRLASVCPVSFITKISTLYELNVALPQDPVISLFGLPLTQRSLPKEVKQTVLLVDNQTLTLKLAPGISATGYHGRLVAASGNFNVCDATIDVASSLNLTQVPKM